MRILNAMLICALLGAVPGLAADKPPRNVLLLAIDTLGADHMSLYGYAKETTPRLDAFAADATTFRHAYSPSA
jgi:glucan phosphoethanolaminetransferase (alkaline phosphatase superfamily)